MAELAHPFARSVFRGVRHRCPACGEGKLFWRYLKVQPRCEACACDLSQYRADDGPAYLTILVIGHLMVAPILFFPVVWQHPAWSIPILLTSLVAIALFLLARIKGGWVGMMYSLGVSERDAALHTANAAD